MRKFPTNFNGFFVEFSKGKTLGQIAKVMAAVDQTPCG